MNRTAFNKYNPDDLLAALVDILEKYELDVADEVKRLTPKVQREWRNRDREIAASTDVSKRVARRWLSAK